MLKRENVIALSIKKGVGFLYRVLKIYEKSSKNKKKQKMNKFLIKFVQQTLDFFAGFDTIRTQLRKRTNQTKLGDIIS